MCCCRSPGAESARPKCLGATRAGTARWCPHDANPPSASSQPVDACEPDPEHERQNRVKAGHTRADNFERYSGAEPHVLRPNAAKREETTLTVFQYFPGTLHKQTHCRSRHVAVGV